MRRKLNLGFKQERPKRVGEGRMWPRDLELDDELASTAAMTVWKAHRCALGTHSYTAYSKTHQGWQNVPPWDSSIQLRTWG